MGLAAAPVSLEAPIGEDGNGRVADIVPDENGQGPSSGPTTRCSARASTAPSALLTDRERKVIELRYGLTDAEPQTLEQIGQDLGITRERVRQIETNSLRKLKRLPQAQSLRDDLGAPTGGPVGGISLESDYPTHTRTPAF